MVSDSRLAALLERYPLRPLLFTMLVSTWVGVWALSFEPLGVARNFWHFALLGLTGAIVANSTGAGGGVVFMPFFKAAGISPTEALGTSLLIQCFGMTAGSLSWLVALRRGAGPIAPALAYQILAWSVLPSLLGMWAGQFYWSLHPQVIMPGFRLFSIVLGALLLLVTLYPRKRRKGRAALATFDRWLILAVALSGGLVTSWVSVGVGEFLALALILRGYPVLPAVAAAVGVSAVTVLGGAPLHVLLLDTVVWEIVLFAAPAAILGGVIARLLAERLGPQRLKLFFSLWILVTGLLME